MVKLRGRSRFGGIGDDLYTGAAAYGKINVYITSFVMGIIAIITFIIGITVTKTRDVYVNPEKMLVTSVQPQLTYYNDKPSTIFIVGGKVSKCGDTVIPLKNVDNYNPPFVGQTIDAFIATDCATQKASVVKDNNKLFGGVLMGIAVLIVFICILIIYLARRFKFFAAAAGVSGASNLFRN